MKKSIIALIFVFLTQSASAQESVPLFEDIPAYESSSSASTQTASPVSSGAGRRIDLTPKASQTAEMERMPAQASKTSGTIQRPKLGRDAEPLSSLVIAPFPNTTIEIDPSSKKVKETLAEEKYTESQIKDEDLIKRSTPLTMTESDKAGAQKVMQEKARALSLNRHDASKFKLAGIGFGWDSESVYDELSELGYTLQRVEKSIPLFRTSYYENLCRQQHRLTIVDEIRRCILEYAESDEVHYVFRETYVRPQSRETIQVSYSSPETMNVVYKIVYRNLGDNSLNTSRKSMAKKMRRQEDFWNMIFDTYGLPDENDKLIWGNPDTVYMQVLMRGSAYDAYIILEDRLIQDKDYEAAQSDFATLRRPTAFTINGELPQTDEED